MSAEPIGADCQIVEVTTDTRKVTAGCLFVALKGERFDAHDFAADAIAAGAGALLVSKRLLVDVPQLVVKDTRLALGQLGAWVRQQVPARVVALTGSSGKTSVKEMTAAILRECGEVLYTAGNFNNDIGVPLTLLRLEPQHDFAVIELGANHIGEIAYTTALTRPQTALVNNLAAAHLKASARWPASPRRKVKSLPACRPTAWRSSTPITTTGRTGRACWAAKPSGASPQAAEGVDFFAHDVRVNGAGTQFTLHSPFGTAEIALPLPGRHNVANALAATALAMSVGATLEAVRQGLKQLQAVPGRLFPVALAEGKLLLDDSYNANVGSMTAAAQVLAEMPGYRVMVVGDMAELGAEAEECHRQVGEAARQAGVDKVISVGGLSRVLSEASGNGEHYQDKTAVIARVAELLSEHAVITVLIKGSRSAAMEQVVRALQEKAPC